MINPNNIEEIKDDYNNLNISYTPLELTSSDFYYSEINKFSEILAKNFDNFYRNEKAKNKMATIFICIGVIFFSAIIIQYLTFADISNILFCDYTSNSIINFFGFILALIYFTGFFAIFYMINYIISIDITLNFADYYDNLFSNYSIAYIELIKSIFIPIPIYLIYSKIFFWSFFYSNFILIQDAKSNEEKWDFHFLFKNLFRNIKLAVLRDGALAYIYLLRIYCLLFTIIFSMVLFYFVNGDLYFYSSNKLLAILVYNPNELHAENLKFYLKIIIVNIIFLDMQIIHFFNYPKFSKTRQVFDSLFILYDMKLINSLDIKSTCEKDVLQSLFIKEFLNFDFQSEIYHYTANGMDFPDANLSEVNFYYRIKIIV